MTSLEKLNLLHPKIRQSALDAYTEAVKLTTVGCHPVIDQTLRTFAESDAIYAKGRTVPGEIVSNAKAGQSYHNYGLALDFHLVINGKDSWDVDHNWILVAGIFKQHGFAWGGNFTSFKDYPHLENRCGFNWRDLLKKYNDKDFIEGTQYINI